MTNPNEQTRKVRTTLRPDEEIDVTLSEYIDLARQGQLIEQAQARASRTIKSDGGKS